MGGLKLPGGLWMIAGLSSAVLVLVALDEPVLMALLVGGAVVGLTIGAFLFARPGPSVVRWSSIAGVAWLIAFGALTLTQLDKPFGQLFSALWLTGFGVAGALVAQWRRAVGASA
jgi:hypothetical protein